MNIEDFKKLSVEDAFAAAGQFAGTDASTFDGLWSAESARGKQMLSPAGAEGHFQLMPGTRKLLEKKLGLPIDPNNFHESLFGAMHHLKDDLTREKGDLPNALRAYNNGPNWREKADPRGENAAYAQRVLGPAYAPGAGGSAAVGPSGADAGLSTPARPVRGEFAGLGTVMPLREVPKGVGGGMTKTAAAIREWQENAGLMTPPRVGGNPVLDQNELAAREAVAAETERRDLGFLDASRAMFMHTGLVGAALRSASRSEYTDDPAWVVPEAELKGMTADDQEYVLASRSRPEFDRLKSELEWEKEDLRKASLNGTGYMLAAGLFAGLPEGYITGIGAAKAMAMVGKGSMQAARQGRYGAAVGRSAVENIGGNVLTTAGEDLIGGRVSSLDYAVAALVGVPFVGLDGFVLKGASIKGAADTAVRTAIQRQIEIADEAVKNLGDGATPEQVRVEMDRIEAAGLRADIKEVQAKPAVREKLLSDLDELEAEEIAAEQAGDADVDAPTTDRATSDAVGLGSEFSTGTPSEVAPGPVLSPNLLNVRRMTEYNDGVEAGVVFGKEFTRKQLWADHPGEPMTPREFVDKNYGDSVKMDEIETLAPGLHTRSTSNKMTPQQIAVAQYLQKTFLSDFRIVLADGADVGFGGGKRGDAFTVGDRLAIVRFDSGLGDWQHTMIHEFGHVIWTNKLGKSKHRDAIRAIHDQWMKRYSGASPTTKVDGVKGTTATAMERSPVTSSFVRGTLKTGSVSGFIPSLMDVIAQAVRQTSLQKLPNDSYLKYGTEYIPNLDEFGAEQFVKYIEAAVAKELGWKPEGIPKAVTDFFYDLWAIYENLFRKAKETGLIKPAETIVDFFESIRKESRARVTKAKREAAGLDPNRDPKVTEVEGTKTETDGIEVSEATIDDAEFERLFGGQQDVDAPAEMANARPWPQRKAGVDYSFMQDPVAVKFGLDQLPVDTARNRAEVKALIELYKKADDPAQPWNNIDPKELKTLTDNSVFNVASTGLLMLKSKNPVSRMVAATLLESTTGSAGRRPTASIAKFMNDRKIMGNVINDLQAEYGVWRNQHGGGMWKDITSGEHWEKFNRLVAEEIEFRRTDAGQSQSPYSENIRNAADKIEAAYDRARIMQVDNKTSGWASLGETSRGYMPHKLSHERILNMTRAESEALTSALVDQFVGVDGWDFAFSQNLAAKYLDRARIRARGGHVVPAHMYNPGAADVIQDALTAMGMTADEVRDQMARYTRGAAGHTKKRLDIDLLQVHKDGERTFTLMDLYDTDQIGLLRHQGQRVAGEAALAGYGIMGKPGLDLIRRGLMFGEDGGKVDFKELEAFDQTAAEFLGDAYGNYGGKWLNRATQLNGLARLGGMGFTQFAEGINMAAHLGVARAVKGVLSLGRLRKEAVALSRGEKVDSILTSIEKVGGAEFGTDAYKMVFPFDNRDLQYQVHGHDTVTLADRLLRGGQHAQAKLSFWRAIHGAQQRAAAEQIVHKAIRYIRTGKEDIALADMGFTPEVQAAVRAQLGTIAKFDAAGDLIEFDITKMVGDEADTFIQAVHRGTGQIIQGTYIGETGKWAHDGWLRMLTQFRTFSITSVEKQWARQRNNRGTAVALGILMGAMSAAAPIYMARVYVQSLGRPDQEEYLERRLAWDQVARATLNYVAMSGLAGDFLDALSATTGLGKTTGGRTGGNETEFVGTVIAPAAGLADDLWRGLQNSRDGTNVHDLVKNLPFSKLPWLIPAINLMDD